LTITIALRTPEAVILGADSTTTVTDKTGKVAQLFNSAQKIFEIGPRIAHYETGKKFTGGIATYNAGSFGPISWRNLINNFYRRVVKPASDPLDVSREFLKFAQTEWSALQQGGQIPTTLPIPEAGFMIASVNKGECDAFCGRVELRQGTIEPLDVGGMQIGGGFEVVSRLIWGYDAGLEPILAQLGVNVGQFKQMASSFQAVPPVPTLPLRDAIDFVHFLIYSAIKLHRYRGATAKIGGAIEIAAITADRGFRWILHKPLHESIGIPRGREL
jgi:hypothetical protein